MKKFLKITGLHHGFGTVCVIFIFHWFDGGSNAAYFMIGWFFSKEVSESMHRKWSNNPLVIAKKIEWMDFVTPCLIAAAYIRYV